MLETSNRNTHTFVHELAYKLLHALLGARQFGDLMIMTWRLWWWL
jgi:hypothetical protein